MRKIKDALRPYITLPLVAFIILACTNAYAITSVQTSAKDARNDLAVQTYKTQLAGCARTNDLRDAITSVLRSASAQVSDAAKAGKVPKDDAVSAERFYSAQMEKVRPIDCDKVYPAPKLG